MIVAALAAGCAAPATPAPLPTEAATAPPTAAPTDVPPATPTAAPTPPFTPATYTDDFAGYSIDFPADWTLDESGAGAKSQRGYYVQLTSWPHAPGDISPETHEGGSRMDFTGYQWDPKNDLDAYIATRKVAWEASGFPLLAEDEWTLSGGLRAVRFLVQAPEEVAYFQLMAIGEMYLVLSGAGDLEMFEAIGRTVRPLSAP
jgi:hypothetical protein